MTDRRSRSFSPPRWQNNNLSGDNPLKYPSPHKRESLVSSTIKMPNTTSK